jgi:hypothetical protein
MQGNNRLSGERKIIIDGKFHWKLLRRVFSATITISTRLLLKKLGQNSLVTFLILGLQPTIILQPWRTLSVTHQPRSCANPKLRIAMCNALVFQLAPTIICVCHLGTGDFRGGSLTLAPFFMYPCGPGSFKSVCVLVGMIFCVWLFLFLFHYYKDFKSIALFCQYPSFFTRLMLKVSAQCKKSPCSFYHRNW